MNKILSAFFFLIAIVLTSCGDDKLVQGSDLNQLKQSIYVVPEKFSGVIHAFYAPVNAVYLDTNESVKFWAGYTSNGEFISHDSISDYFQSTLWNINETEYSVPSFRYAFDKPGHYQATLSTVDFFNDTLRDTVNIYVNNPAKISIIFPENGYNQVDPTDPQGLKLKFLASGTDFWETSTCLLYISTDKDSVWNSLIGRINCFEETNLHGLEYSDTAHTYYWGIKYFNEVEANRFEKDSTPVFRFSTQMANTDSSILKIPVVYRGMQDSVYTDILLINAQGDTLQEIINQEPNAIIKTKVASQTGLRIILNETKKIDFGSQELVVNIPKSTQVETDSVIFIDSISPGIELIQRDVGARDLIKFYVLDNGTGVNSKTITFTQGNKILPISYEAPFITFQNSCEVLCKLYVQLEDRAKNTLSGLYWNISVIGDNAHITGPHSVGEVSP